MHRAQANAPCPIDSLISYHVIHDSCLGRKKYIKVDFFCGVKIPSSSQLITSGFSLFAFDTEHDMNILTRGSLLGDKLTTVALGTIGLKPNRQTEIAKQIYDMGTLLKIVTKPDLLESFDAFERLTCLKVGNFNHDPKYEVSDIVDSIEESVSGLLNLKPAVSITGIQGTRHASFKSTYLPKRASYKKTEHVTDILLVSLYNRYVRRYLGKEITRNGAADSLHGILRQLNAIKGKADNAPEMRTSYIRDIPDSVSFNKKILNAALLEHVFLLRELHS